MIEDYLILNGLERDISYDENTIIGIENLSLQSDLPLDEFLNNLKLYSLSDLLDYNKRLTINSIMEYCNHLEKGEIFHKEIIADLILDKLEKTQRNVLYFVDSLYGHYFLYIESKGDNNNE